MAKNNKEWYETLFGLIVVGVGLNLFSNFLYDRTRKILAKQEYKRNQKLLQDYKDSSCVHPNEGINDNLDDLLG